MSHIGEARHYMKLIRELNTRLQEEKLTEDERFELRRDLREAEIEFSIAWALAKTERE